MSIHRAQDESPGRAVSPGRNPGESGLLRDWYPERAGLASCEVRGIVRQLFCRVVRVSPLTIHFEHYPNAARAAPRVWPTTRRQGGWRTRRNGAPGGRFSPGSPEQYSSCKSAHPCAFRSQASDAASPEAKEFRFWWPNVARNLAVGNGYRVVCRYHMSRVTIGLALAPCCAGRSRPRASLSRSLMASFVSCDKRYLSHW